MRYVGSDMPLIPELNNTELWVYIENSAPNPPSLFVSLSLRRRPKSLGFEGCRRATCQSWKCSGQLPVIRQILKTKWHVWNWVSIHWLLLHLHTGQWWTTGWIYQRHEREDEKRLPSVKVQLWHLTHQKAIRSAPDTFAASPIPIHFHPIFLHFLLIWKSIAAPSTPSVWNSYTEAFLVLGKKFQPQLGRNRRERDRLMRSVGQRHQQQPSGDVKVTPDNRTPAKRQPHLSAWSP